MFTTAKNDNFHSSKVIETSIQNVLLRKLCTLRAFQRQWRGVPNRSWSLPLHRKVPWLVKKSTKYKKNVGFYSRGGTYYTKFDPFSLLLQSHAPSATLIYIPYTDKMSILQNFWCGYPSIGEKLSRKVLKNEINWFTRRDEFLGLRKLSEILPKERFEILFILFFFIYLQQKWSFISL